MKGVCQLCFFRHALVERDDVFHDDEIKVGRRLRGLLQRVYVEVKVAEKTARSSSGLSTEVWNAAKRATGFGEFFRKAL